MKELKSLIISAFRGRGRLAIKEFKSYEFDKLAVTRNPIEISAVIRKSDKEYVVYFCEKPLEYACTCKDQSTRKTFCKHLIALLLKCYELGELTEEDIKRIVNYFTKQRVTLEVFM